MRRTWTPSGGGVQRGWGCSRESHRRPCGMLGIMQNDRSREAVEKHLDLIQAVITRMAQNSFLLKGWSLTVITGLTALLVDSGRHWMALPLLLLPLLAFWLLDAYFLQQERLFQKIYEEVVSNADTPRYSLNPADVLGSNYTVDSVYRIALASKNSAGESVPNTIRAFHMPLLVLVVLATAGLGWQATHRPDTPTTSPATAGPVSGQPMPPPKGQGKKKGQQGGGAQSGGQQGGQ